MKIEPDLIMSVIFRKLRISLPVSKMVIPCRGRLDRPYRSQEDNRFELNLRQRQNLVKIKQFSGDMLGFDILRRKLQLIEFFQSKFHYELIKLGRDMEKINYKVKL